MTTPNCTDAPTRAPDAVGPARWSSQEKRVALALALVVLTVAVAQVCTLYARYTWINRDGRFYANLNTTIVEDFSLEQSGFASSWYHGRLGWNRNLPASFSNIAVGRNGEYWPMHPWLMPVLSTPLFFAFGLPATLIFNLMMFGLIAAFGYRFVREYASPASAALAISTLLFGTAIHAYAYDYHIDILLLALFASALAALVSHRGGAMGALLGAILIIKPTGLLLLPAVLLLLWERRDSRALKRALVGGAAVLGVAAGINLYLFGRPWWFGYNRVLTVENGVQKVVSDLDAFSTPMGMGIRRMWSGAWGLSHRQTLMALALPGLVALATSSWRYTLGACLTALLGFLVFAKYHYEGDRFHWPAMALLLPALAATFDLLGKALAALLLHLRVGGKIARLGPALATSGLCLMAVVATLPFGRPATQRLGDSAYVLGALALGQQGTLDQSQASDPEATGDRPDRGFPMIRDRFGHWLPRTSLAAGVLAAPFALVGGRVGLLLLHLLAAAVAVFATVRLLERVASPALAVAAVSGLFLLPWFREAVVRGGPALLAAAPALTAVLLACQHRFATAGALGVLAAWVADAPWLSLLSVLSMAETTDGSTLKRLGLAAGAVLSAWGLGYAIFIGWPFVSVTGSSVANLAMSVAKGPGRAVVFLLILAGLGLLATARRDWRLALALAVMAASVALPGVVAGSAPEQVLSPLLLLLLAVPLAPLSETLSDMISKLIERLGRKRLWLAGAGLLVLLLAVGTVWRVARACQPFRIGSEKAMRAAAVRLGEIPCDFIPWEHLSWECSHLDKGHFNQVGFALPDGVHLGGRRVDLLLIPSGLQGQERSVAWREVEASDVLTLRYAAPDQPRGRVEVTVLVDGEELDRFQTSQPPDGRIHTRRVATSRAAGRRVSLRIQVRALDRPGAAVALDGGWE